MTFPGKLRRVTPFHEFFLNRSTQDDLMIEKCLSGFTRFASVAAHYRMSDVIDNLVVSLSKFSGLQNVLENPQMFVPHFGKLFFASYCGGCNTKHVQYSNGSPLFGFPMAFCFEQNGSHFVQNQWKSEQNVGHFVWISKDSVLEWSGVGTIAVTIATIPKPNYILEI